MQRHYSDSNREVAANAPHQSETSSANLPTCDHAFSRGSTRAAGAPCRPRRCNESSREACRQRGSHGRLVRARRRVQLASSQSNASSSCDAASLDFRNVYDHGDAAPRAVAAGCLPSMPDVGDACAAASCSKRSSSSIDAIPPRASTCRTRTSSDAFARCAESGAPTASPLIPLHSSKAVGVARCAQGRSAAWTNQVRLTPSPDPAPAPPLVPHTRPAHGRATSDKLAHHSTRLPSLSPGSALGAAATARRGHRVLDLVVDAIGSRTSRSGVARLATQPLWKELPASGAKNGPTQSDTAKHLRCDDVGQEQPTHGPHSGNFVNLPSGSAPPAARCAHGRHSSGTASAPLQKFGSAASTTSSTARLPCE